MKMFTCKFAQDEVTHQRLWVGSNKSVQQGRSHFDARNVCGIREHEKMATCLREAAPAKAGNAAGGFFQQTLLVYAGMGLGLTGKGLWPAAALLHTGVHLINGTRPNRIVITERNLRWK